MSRNIRWDQVSGPGVPNFDAGDAGSGWLKLGENLMNAGVKNRELALREQLQAAQIADYQARTKGTGAYARTGGSGGSGGGSGVAATDWEAYKANAGLVPSQQQQQQALPAEQALKQSLERPVAPTGQELPRLTEITEENLKRVNPAYDLRLEQKQDINNAYQTAIDAGGRVNPNLAGLQQSLEAVRSTPMFGSTEEVLALGPDGVKGKATATQQAVTQLEQAIKVAQQPYTSPALQEQLNAAHTLHPQVEEERKIAERLLGDENLSITGQINKIKAQDEAARQTYLNQMEVFNKATKETTAPTSQQAVNAVTEAIGSGVDSKTSESFPDLNQMGLNDLRQYRSRYRESYLNTLNKPLTTPPEFIQRYRQDAINNLEAKAAAYGRTPNRKEIGAMEQSIGPGAAKAWQEQQKSRYGLYEKEIEDWIKIKEGSSKEVNNALLNKIREGNPSSVHSDLTKKITGWESIGDALTPGSGGQNRAEQSINNLYTYANENGIKLPKMQEAITKSLQALINDEPISPDWNVDLFFKTLRNSLNKEDALPKNIKDTDLKKLLMPESMGIF